MGGLKRRCLRWTAGFWRWLTAWLRPEPEGEAPPPIVPAFESRMTIDVVVELDPVPPGLARLAALLDPGPHDPAVRPPGGLAADRP